MGATTATAKVWYADTTDSAKLDSVTALMASSIENGLGARMTLRETQVGVKASSDMWTIPSTNTFTTVPVSVTTSHADFNAGFTLASSGVATCQTPGMYIVTASLGVNGPDSSGASASVKAAIVKNGAIVLSTEVALSTTIWANAVVTTTINCVAGDTIQMQGTLAGTPASAHASFGQTSALSAALVNATHA